MSSKSFLPRRWHLVSIALAACTVGAHAQSRHGLIEPGLDRVSELEVVSDSMVSLHLGLETDDASWAQEGRESIVVEALLDGERVADLVVFAERERYSLSLGHLEAGTHRLELRYDSERSPVADGRVATSSPDEVRTTSSPCDRYAPVLVSRAGSRDGRPLGAFTDTPLLLTCEQGELEDGGTRLLYSVLWSNEDGGTGWQPALLLARWGRTSDIEWVYAVELDRAGEVLRETYQSRGHGVAEFAGEHLGRRPLLQVAADNNNLTDEVEEHLDRTVRWSPAPLFVRDRGWRERLMDRSPWMHRVADAEMKREYQLGFKGLGLHKCEEPGDAATTTISDLRNYLHVDLDLRMAGRQDGLRVSARVGAQWFHSDHQRRALRYTQLGRGRTTVELPPGTRGKPLEALRVEAFGLEAEERLELHALRAFRVDQDFRPRSPELELGEPVVLDAEGPSHTWSLEER